MRCRLCGQRYPNKAALLLHCGGVLPEAEDDPFYCSCGAAFCSPQALQLHCERTFHAPEGAEAYEGSTQDIECPMCDTIFESEEALRSHCGGNLPEAVDEPSWCSCGRAFCSARALVDHFEATGHQSELQDDYWLLSTLDENNYRRGLSDGLMADFARRAHLVTHADDFPEDPITKDRPPVGARVVPLPCGHVFEQRMLWKWFERHRTCPVCRSELED